MQTVVFTQFASGNVFDALGINWQMLIFQIIGFLVLVWVMGKFVYPVLMKQVDKRHAEIEASTKAAREAEEHAAKAQAEIDKLLRQARKEATDIVGTAKEEATQMMAAAEEKSREHAGRIVDEAHASIARDVEAAKRALHNETIELVAMATQKVVTKAVDVKADSRLIEAALKESK